VTLKAAVAPRVAPTGRSSGTKLPAAADSGDFDPGARSSAWPKLQKKLEAAAAALEAARRAHRAGLA
jgi:hypothetical protein